MKVNVRNEETSQSLSFSENVYAIYEATIRLIV